MYRTLVQVLLLAGAPALALPTARAGEEKHKAAHDGCLNALGTCENGHAEVKIENAVLKLWFVGGGTSTDRAVRIPDREITLAVVLDGAKEAKTLVLKAKPSELAEETEGDCSQFEGQADWLKGVTKFTATASVSFKGKKQALRIEYPAGFDPDDDEAPKAEVKK